MSRNPRRTTKCERAEVRRSNPTVCRTIGIAAAARLQRQRRMRPEADQLDALARAAGLEPLMTESGAPGVNHWSAYDQATTEHWSQQFRNWVLNGTMTSPDGRVRADRMSGHKIAYTIIDDPMPGTEPVEYDLYVDADGTPTVDYSRGVFGQTPLQMLREQEGSSTYTESSGYEVEPDGWINIKYPPHISLGTHQAERNDGQ